MNIMYEEGPEIIYMGEAGMFMRGKPKEVPDDIAEALLEKTTIKFHIVKKKKEKGEN